MKKLKVNLCVVNLNDGGDVYVERFDDMDEDYQMIYEEDEEKDEVSLVDGLKELDDYFNDYGERDEEEIELFEQLKKDYVELIGDRKGKFYLWGIEYDLELMFEES
jgi:hypothetical protein